MKQYIITGYDHTDEGAIDRRMAVRPQHLEGAKELKANNNYIMGGAILDDEGKMIGSVMVLQFETEEELEAWKKREIYITAGVWETVEVKPFRVVYSTQVN
ncbi:YciI family protein [uncultured Mucilaginibacter sp.]|uniref:YciI family protein n=1 Tax=uncultured Mucilaginibacter sp. TaxID=797541 RepID=UPI0025FE6D80|nr:YciI family protein [uncultured Mucilaginibacter sp.]